MNKNKINTIDNFTSTVDYSFMENLTVNPSASLDGNDHQPRQVTSGHYVNVAPTPILNPKYVSHSKTFFNELGLDDSLANDKDFIKIFSGDMTNAKKPMKTYGWATGYALSIYGTEYYDQCPFGNGNGYGDGRAMSIYEGILNNKRVEMQLKGGGRTPYCRGADGRAVFRSSIREFLAQEHMHALEIPTTRSLTLYVSQDEKVRRPWFNEGSYSRDPERMIEEPVAITTRVASSFLRVGQLELFGRRARKNEHPNALKELEQIVRYAIKREYSDIDQTQSLEEQIISFAIQFRTRLTSLVANWVRVGYCQGNFNSDNTAIGGFTLDYGPFGFIDLFDLQYQPWTGGGVHFSFLNQPNAAYRNYHMFCKALKPLLKNSSDYIEQLEKIENDFMVVMDQKMAKMWCSKIGIKKLDADLVNDLIRLMLKTKVDYTIFFRELSHIPDEISALLKSFYNEDFYDEEIINAWSSWLNRWHKAIAIETEDEKIELSNQLKKINPKYTLREWFLVPAYKKAHEGDFSLLHELQEVMNDPYSEQSKDIEEKYYREKPFKYFDMAGVSHMSCSS